MQIKVNFLCKDSVLAAPLVLEIARVLDLAQQRGEAGPQEQMSLFFKAPQTSNGRAPEHSFPVQERMLMEWLGVDGSAEGRRMNTQERAAGQAPPALMPTIRALADLKRVRSAGRAGRGRTPLRERLGAGRGRRGCRGGGTDHHGRRARRDRAR
jgi:hypothetical protein